MKGAPSRKMSTMCEPCAAFAMTWVAHANGGNYAIVQSVWIAIVAVLLAILTWFGPEAHGAKFGVTPETDDATMRGSSAVAD